MFLLTHDWVPLPPSRRPRFGEGGGEAEDEYGTPGHRGEEEGRGSGSRDRGEVRGKGRDDEVSRRQYRERPGNPYYESFLIQEHM